MHIFSKYPHNKAAKRLAQYPSVIAGPEAGVMTARRCQPDHLVLAELRENCHLH